MLKIWLFLPFIALSAACAKTPSSIAPVAVSSSEYAGKSCKALQQEFRTVSAKLKEAEEKQRSKVAGDAVVVFLILVPPSALTGDHEADIALYKGEKLAIEREISNKKC